MCELKNTYDMKGVFHNKEKLSCNGNYIKVNTHKRI